MTHNRILSEKTTFKGEENTFEVREVELEFPNKKRATHYIAERVPVSVVFPITSKNELILINQYRYLLKKTIIEAVSGRIDKGETSLAAAKRELLEEAGLIAGGVEELTRIELASSFFRAKATLFIARDLEFVSQDLEESEQIEVFKMPIAEAVKKVADGEIQAASTIIGILMIDKLRREKKL